LLQGYNKDEGSFDDLKDLIWPKTYFMYYGHNLDLNVTESEKSNNNGGDLKVKVIDIRDACCLISAGADKQLEELASGEQVELIISLDVGEEMLSEVTEKENCQILETKTEGDIIRASVKKK